MIRSQTPARRHRTNRYSKPYRVRWFLADRGATGQDAFAAHVFQKATNCMLEKVTSCPAFGPEVKLTVVTPATVLILASLIGSLNISELFPELPPVMLTVLVLPVSNPGKRST